MSNVKVTGTVHCFLKVQSYHKNWAIEKFNILYRHLFVCPIKWNNQNMSEQRKDVTTNIWRLACKTPIPKLCCVHCIWEVRCFPFSSSKFPSSQVECVHAHFPSKLGNKMEARITCLFWPYFREKNSQWRNYLGGFTGLHDWQLWQASWGTFSFER